MKKIKYLVMDVDGTLTDGKIYMSNNGEFCKAFNIKDGLGIHDLLIPNDILPIIITGRESDIVSNRCKELGINMIYQGVSDKLEMLVSIIGDLSMVAYIGDDINDYLCMQKVKNARGITACPKDAVAKIKDIADFISEYDGGDGAVRDFIEWLLK